MSRATSRGFFCSYSLFIFERVRRRGEGEVLADDCVGGKWAERLTRRERSDTAALGTLHTRPDRVVRRSCRGSFGAERGRGEEERESSCGGANQSRTEGEGGESLCGREEETLCGRAKRRLRQTVHIRRGAKRRLLHTALGGRGRRGRGTRRSSSVVWQGLSRSPPRVSERVSRYLTLQSVPRPARSLRSVPWSPSACTTSSVPGRRRTCDAA